MIVENKEIGIKFEVNRKEDFDKWCAIREEQIRADAIEEFKDKLLELCECGIERADCTGGNCYKCLDNQVDYSSIVDLAEELKEKKE